MATDYRRGVHGMKDSMQIFVDEKKYCCGQATEVKGVYDVETEKQSILFVCKCCMKAIEIDVNQ